MPRRIGVHSSHLAVCEVERQRKQETLSSCLRTIRIAAIAGSTEARAEVERFISKHALPDSSVEWLTAEAFAILDRRRSQEAAADVSRAAKAHEELLSASHLLGAAINQSLLMRRGREIARRLIVESGDWDAVEIDDTVEEIRRRLGESIDPTWTERRVEKQVRAWLDEDPL